MAITDYDLFPGTVDVEIALETSAPIDGSGAVYFRKAPVGANRHGAMRRNVVGQRYLRSGAERAIFEPKINTNAGGSRSYYGFVFLLDADSDISQNGGAADFYLAGYDTQGGTGSLGAWGVWHFANNLYSAPTTLATFDDTTIAIDTPFTLDVEWRQDPTELQGVQIILSKGTWDDQNPFADLAPVIDTLHLATNGALMGDSFGEGVGFRNTGTPEMRFLVDKISGDSAAIV